VSRPSEGSAARSAEPESMPAPAPREGSTEMQDLQRETENRERGERSSGEFQQRFGGVDRGLDGLRGGSGRRRR
jgi:hypothetical protein